MQPCWGQNVKFDKEEQNEARGRGIIDGTVSERLDTICQKEVVCQASWR